MRKFYFLSAVLLFSFINCFSQVGTLVPSFGFKGIVNTNIIDVNKGREIFNAVAIQPDGKIIAAGITMIPGVIVRYNPDGSLDNSFANDGMLFCYGFKFTDLVLQPDGRILAIAPAGLVRLTPNGSFDISFDGVGLMQGVYTDPVLALQNDGKILVGSGSSLRRFNSNGSPDSSFHSDGVATVYFAPGQGGIRDLAIQFDGKIVAVGGAAINGNGVFGVARCNADGSSDNSFDGDGMLTTPFFPYWKTQATTVAIQNDGKILVGGYSLDNFCLARYNVDGSLDAGFDTDGKFSVSIGSSASYTSYVYPTPLAIKTNGKILAAALYNDEFSIMRINADGSFDAGFGNNGKIITDLTSRKDQPICMAVNESIGKIIVAGYSHMQAESDFAMVSYNDDGSLDTNFDGDGKLNYHFGTSWDIATSLTVQNDGKILVAGSTGLVEVGSNNDIAIIRYNTNGTIDSSFDMDGKVILDIGNADDRGNTLAIQNDGKILVAGTSRLDFSLARYNTDGSLDNSFDTDGKVTTDFNPISNSIDAATCMAIQTDGKIVLAGYTGRNLDWDIALARYNHDGSPDNSFNGNGKVIKSLGSPSDRVSCMAIQTDGKIVLGGVSAGSFVLLRFNTDGSLDNTFDGDGVLSNSIAAPRSLAIQPDGKIVTISAGSPGFVINRYKPDGSPDNSFDGDGILTNTEVAGSPNSVTIQNNGKILVTGTWQDGYFFRYNSDGSLDNSFDGDGKAFLSLAPVTVHSITTIKFHGNRIYVAGEIRTAGGSDFFLAAAFAEPSGAPSMLIVNFSGKLINNDAVLNWNTKNESNMLEYVVERSVDGRNFVPVDYATARNTAGTNYYSVTDYNVVALRSSFVYYRLKQKGLDGSFTYSRIVVLPVDKSLILFYPNPVINEANLVFTLKRQTKVLVRIIDNKGRIVQQQQLNLSVGNTSLSMDVTTLAGGIYYMVLRGEGINYTKKFVK